MFQDALAGQVAELIESDTVGDAECSASRIWQQTAEDCVLARLKTIRIYGGLPCHKQPLSQPERVNRLQALLRLWANGCICAVDEELFADLLYRRDDQAV
ncbi:hypothetical protein [Labrenzia sp. PHM005]|uniref:hypothetical protein n=1 Tax=Labrenzia sp. PHM005 TaxID=2590016 RepID=UPI0011401DCC|nr:hypothetical protein [Labrenzia sp. PHM005]QDG79191.1 hypothetical protein FJ695_26825 [Labrenzia sp. PHM005]